MGIEITTKPKGGNSAETEVFLNITSRRSDPPIHIDVRPSRHRDRHEEIYLSVNYAYPDRDNPHLKVTGGHTGLDFNIRLHGPTAYDLVDSLLRCRTVRERIKRTFAEQKVWPDDLD